MPVLHESMDFGLDGRGCRHGHCVTTPGSRLFPGVKAVSGRHAVVLPGLGMRHRCHASQFLDRCGGANALIQRRPRVSSTHDRHELRRDDRRQRHRPADRHLRHRLQPPRARPGGDRPGELERGPARFPHPSLQPGLALVGQRDIAANSKQTAAITSWCSACRCSSASWPMPSWWRSPSSTRAAGRPVPCC